jgi:two-component system, OmpR family, response regulator MtrA
VHVLMIDDDPDLLDITGYALRREGMAVTGATDGRTGLDRWRAGRPDLVLLDVNLPGTNGYEVCRQLRSEGDTPIIMLTARYEDDDVVRGFRDGADDYVTKPFSLRQLVARIRAVLQRARPGSDAPVASAVRVSDLVLDLRSHEVRKGDRAIRFTPLQFRVLYMLMMNAGHVVSYSRLVEYGWGYDGGDSLLLKTHVCHIRSKLGVKPEEPCGIRVGHGGGYVINRDTAAGG